MNKYKQLLETILIEETYKEFFQAALKKFDVKSPNDFKTDEDKKKFFDYIDKNWKGDGEKPEKS